MFTDPGLMTLTAVAGTIAPVESSTLPRMLPVDCPKSRQGARRNKKRTRNLMKGASRSETNFSYDTTWRE